MSDGLTDSPYGSKAKRLYNYTAHPKDIDPPLSREERRLIEALRSHPWGEATVILKGGKPVMVKGIREDVKLTDR